MKNKLQKIIWKTIKQTVLALVVLIMIFPYNTLLVLADPVPVEEKGWNREWNFRTSEYTNSLVELLGEVVGPIYQLATPGSGLTYDIYRYLMKHTEDELGIDKDFFRRMQKKTAAPTVDIVFAPTNPKEGEKVTAFAVPHGFRNSKNKMYFTWYIVHDGEKNVTEGRDEAMRMVAAGGYDKQLFGVKLRDSGDGDGDRDYYNVSSGGDDGVGKKSGFATTDKECKECECLTNMTMLGGLSKRGCFDDRGELLYSSTEEFDEAVENRGDAAITGRGVVNSDWISRCYRHNFGRQSQDGDDYSGRDLIITCHHAFNGLLGTNDKSFNATDEIIMGTNPENADTDGDGVMDEADLVGLGQDEFTWTYRKGDKVSVAVEGISNIAINEGATERLRYKNAKWEGDDKDLDSSPTTSPEKDGWFDKKRKECQDMRESGSNSEYSDCMKELWRHEKKPENDEKAFGQMTGYYKIMWAAPGICSGEAKELYDNDWCDEKDDLGFQYLKLYDPVERGTELLEVSVNVSPKNPQFKKPEKGDFSDEHSDSTDRIIASANVVSNDSINPDYLYYKWSVWKCDPEDFDKCENVTDELTGSPKFRSRLTGLGQREIWFYPGNYLIDDDKTLLKIGVIVKKHQNSVMSSPGINGDYNKQIFSDKKKDILVGKEYTQKYSYSASKLVEVTRHSMNIKLYQAKPTTNGGWIKDDKEICIGGKDGLYKKICPVYQYQVLAAEVDGAGPSIAWYLNGKRLGPTLNAENNSKNPNSKIIFFPIVGVDGELETIKVISEKENKEGNWEDNNILETRILSIHKPMGQVIEKEKELTSNSIKKATSGILNIKGLEQGKLWWILGISNNDDDIIEEVPKIDIPVKVIPRYLENEVDNSKLIIRGYIENNSIGTVISNPGVTTGNGSWLFPAVVFEGGGGIVGATTNFKVRTIREFSQPYKDALKASFDITPLDELVYDTSIKVKAISINKYEAITGNVVAINTKQKINKFFASTISNAPEYFVFILRLAISFVLVGMVSFGLIQGARKIN